MRLPANPLCAHSEKVSSLGWDSHPCVLAVSVYHIQLINRALRVDRHRKNMEMEPVGTLALGNTVSPPLSTVDRYMSTVAYR